MVPLHSCSRFARRWWGPSVWGLTLFLAGVTALRAQTATPVLPTDAAPFNFYERGPYRPDVPRPAALLGYEPGEFHTTYANYERFLRELTPKTDRLRVFTLGQTPEYRPLYLLAVSSPENLARLDAIKSDVARLADPRTCSEADAAAIAARSPMIVWLSYSIHGDESSAFEAGMQVLYQLTASDDPRIVDALRQCVVLINPAQNPDGHERFTAWYNAEGLGRPEAFAYEHRQPWGIYGRFNHYGFDLNRDMLAGSQIESRTGAAAFLDWHPQVNADHHGETKNFFFPPPAVPVNAALPPDQTEKWQSLLGQGNAAAFNRYHWLYYNRDVFDLYYPGYWDSWPSLHGSAGMTFESDGGGKRGFNWKRDDDTIETLRGAIAKHFTASLATLETSAAHREDRLRDYYRFFTTALAEAQAAKDGVRQVAIAPGSDPGVAAELVANLLRHGIEVRRTSEKFSLANARDYLPGDKATGTKTRDFPPGSYVVDLAQPQARIARTLLEPDAPLDPAFVKRQHERQERNLRRGRREPLENAEFYDITAWCLPLVFGVDAAYSADAPGSAVPGEFVRAANAVSVTLSNQAAPGGQEHAVPLVPATPAVPAVTSYLWTPETEGGYRLAFRLLQEGYRVAASTYPMRAAGRDYPRGTLLARVERNPASLHEHITTLAKQFGVALGTADTAYVDTGSVGPGSEEVVSLKVPKVALIAGDGVMQTSYAEISYLLGKDMGVEYVPMSIEAFRKTRMADFNVLILPDGSAGAYASAFDKDGVKKLKDWCADGGTLICVGGGAGFAADKKTDLSGARVVGAEMLAKQDDEGDDDSDKTKDKDKDKDEDSAAGKPATDKDHQPEGRKAKPVGDESGPDKKAETGAPGQPDEAKKPPEPVDEAKKDAAEPAATPATAEDHSKHGGFDRRKIPLAVPGAIFRATVNRDHFLTYGYEQNTIPVLVDTDQFLTLTKRGANVLTFPAPPAGGGTPAPLRLAGFTWQDNTERLIRGTAEVIEEPVGDGHVILTGNGPSFRLLWRSTTRLWLNGLLYAPAIHGDAN